jgi:hypothetical protein
MATGWTPAYTASSALSDLYKKTNTALMTAIKTKTEEWDWFNDFPDEEIELSANEMRLVLDVNYSNNVANIPEGGYEGVLGTVAPEHGTFTPVQMNKRYSFSTLYQYGWNNKGKRGQIENQLVYEAAKAMQGVAEKVGLMTYGYSTGTMCQVAATGSGSATQTNVQLKNAFGSTALDGSSTAEKTYISSLFREGQLVALIRSGAIVEFGVYNGLGTSGVGYADITFNASITPTADDIVIQAAAVTGATLSETDQNRWTVGLLDATLSASVHGLATSTAPNWASYQDTTGGRWSYAKQEKMFNEIYNNGGVQADRIIWSQGVRRDVIAGERAALRYESSSFDFNGKFGTTGIKYMTSRLAPTGMVFAWNQDVYRKRVLSDKPTMDGGPGMFSLDKVQEKGSVAASINFIHFKAVNNRAGMGIATGLTEQ